MVRSLENSELARSIGLDDIPVIITDPMVIISALPIPLIARPAITTHRLQAIPLFFFFFFFGQLLWDLWSAVTIGTYEIKHPIPKKA